jgi:hypothetical protein
MLRTRTNRRKHVSRATAAIETMEPRLFLSGTWETVPLGGGGYMTDLTSSSDGSTIYARTDVGGAFRWAPTGDSAGNGTWIPLSDDLVPYSTPDADSYMGVESIATDPNNVNRVYISAGYGIWGSDDKGTNWYQIRSGLGMAPNNGHYRANGERMVVDPRNSNVIWYGSIFNGLQKGVKNTTTGAWTWSQVTAVPNGTPEAGVTFVLCDKNTGGSNTIVYAGVYDNTGTTGGVYVSTDAGTNWSKVGGATLAKPERAQVATNGTLYVTANGSYPAKLLRGGTLSLMTTLPTNTAYHAVAVSQSDASGNTVFVSTWDNGVWRSTDGGATWGKQGGVTGAQTEPDGTPSVPGGILNHVATILVNPANPNELWGGGFLGAFRTRDAQNIGTTAGSTWHTLQKGQEETVVMNVKNGATGPRLMLGLADIGGFRYNDFTVRPTGAGGNAYGNFAAGGNTTGLDFSESNANVWARAVIGPSGGGGTGAISNDGGQTWLRFGEIAEKSVTNSSTAGWETWDVGTYLKTQKAKGVNTVTLVVASTAHNAGDWFMFNSKESANPPKLVINGSTSLNTIADTWVEGKNPTTNHGGDGFNAVSYGFGATASSRWSYLKFDLSSVSTINSASLQLHRIAASVSHTFPSMGIYASGNTSWVEGNGGTDNSPAGEMTWNNRAQTYANANDPGINFFPQYSNSSGGLAGGRVAVSATDPNIMTWMPVGKALHYSNDRGVTWTASTGAPASQITGVYTNGFSVGLSGQPLAADRGNGNFYAAKFGGSSHEIFRSTDNGATWSHVAWVGNGGSHNVRTPQLVAAPVSPSNPTGGDVWLTEDADYNGAGGGLWRSTDAAVNWSKIANVGKVTAVSFGKAASGSGYTVFINGYVNGVKGYYQSDDYGASWVSLGVPSIVGATALGGDRQAYGRLFVGTAGRGTFVYNPEGGGSTSSPFGGSPVTIASSGLSTVQAENYDLGGEGVAYHDGDAVNSGGVYRTSESVDIQTTSDVGGGYTVGWTASTEWMKYTVNVASAGTYNVTFRVAGQYNGSLHLENQSGANLTGAVAIASTGGWSNWTNVTVNNVSLPAGVQTLKLVVDTAGFNLNHIAFARVGGGASSPFGGTPVTIASSGTSTVQAENYDLGGEGVAYHDGDAINSGGVYRTSESVDISAATDVGGGYNVGWTANTEWMKYTVNVASAGTYNITFRVAGVYNGSLHLENGAGTNLTGAVAIPSTGGWQTWADVTVNNVSLPAGVQTLKVVIDTAGFNLNHVAFSRAASPFGGSPVTIASSGPTTVQAENYDLGGEGVGYHDGDTVNSGGVYRASESVDLTTTTDTGGGYVVGWTSPTEWMNYTVNVVTAGTYSLTFRVAGVYNGALHLENQAGTNLTGAVAIASTGGWQSWSNVTVSNVSLVSGVQTLKLVTDTAGFNLNWVSFTRTA